MTRAEQSQTAIEADIGASPVPSTTSGDGAMRTITVLDTSAAGNNLGDQIIMEAVRRELADLIYGPLTVTFFIATHQPIWAGQRRLIRLSECAIAGGTNLLSSHMWFRPMWRISAIDAFAKLNVVLMGAGWYQYQRAVDPYTRWYLRRILSPTHLHSVRESYAQEMLASFGITNVVNTGCPTIWALTDAHCAALPRTKSDAVLTTVNSYAGLRNPDADRRMIEMLRRHYRTVYLWIQTNSDYEYARGLDDGLAFVDPNLAALDAMLGAGIELDYVGVRLHAGIRAIQKGRRAIILEIDNRAREMGRDFALPTVERTDYERLERMIREPFEIAVKPPLENINRWKAQFRADRRA